MKTIKVFIASSEELKIERLEFTDMIQQLNRILKLYDIQIEPEKWEYLDSSMGLKHKQEEYNDVLKTCEMCVVLFWKKFGEYSESEFKTAYSELCAGRNPKKLYIYFKEPGDISPELLSFKESFATKYGHFYCHFENVDTMKLNFLLQFEDYQSKNMLIHQRDNLLRIKGAELKYGDYNIANLNSLPFVYNNVELKKLIQLKTECDDTISELEEAYQLSPNQALKVIISKQRVQRNQIENDIKILQEGLLKTKIKIVHLQGEILSERLSKAMELFENGDNKGADALLNYQELQENAKAIVESFERNMVVLHAAIECKMEDQENAKILIKDLLFKVNTLMNDFSNKNRLKEAIEVYRTIVFLVEKVELDDEILARTYFDYAYFLHVNNQFHLIKDYYDKSITVYRKLHNLNRDKYRFSFAYALETASNFNTVTNNYIEAEKKCTESLSLLNETLKPDIKGDQKIVKLLPDCLTQLAYIHVSLKKHDLAKDEVHRALVYYYVIAEKDPERFLPSIFNMSINLGTVLSSLDDNDTALTLYNFAIDNLHSYAKMNDISFKYEMAILLIKIADIQKNDNKQGAIDKYNTSLTLLKELASIDPENYNPDIAKTLERRALLFDDLDNYELAAKDFDEAIELYNDLVFYNPKTYNSQLAHCLLYRSQIHQENDEDDIAEQKLLKALDLYKEMIIHDPHINELYLSHVIFDLASLYNKHGETEKVISELEKCMDLLLANWERNKDLYSLHLISQIQGLLGDAYAQLDKIKESEDNYKKSIIALRKLSQQKYENSISELACTLTNLGILHDNIGRYDLSEKEHKEAISIYSNEAEPNNEEFAKSLNQITNIYINKEDYATAERYIKKANQIVDNPFMMDTYGEVLLCLGRKEEAMNLYYKIEERYPVFFEDYKNKTGEYTTFYNMITELLNLKR